MTLKEKEVITELFRRIYYFHKGNTSTGLIMLEYPSKVKSLVNRGLLTPYTKEINRTLNWYGLTEKGKAFFKSQKLYSISEKYNEELYTLQKTAPKNILEGIIKTFH